MMTKVDPVPTRGPRGLQSGTPGGLPKVVKCGTSEVWTL